MTRFSYAAVSASGARSSGFIRSATPRDAARRLLEMGYHPLFIDDAASAHPSHPRRLIARLHRVRVVDLAITTRQLASLLKAGLPLLRAVETLQRQCANRRLADAFIGIAETLSIQAGSFSEALEQFPDIFDPVYRGLARSGEESGTLPEVLSDLARHLSQSARLRGQVAGAFIYPAFLCLLGVASIFVLMTFVVPRFQDLFLSFGQSLPWPTRALMFTSAFLAQWWWVLLSALGLFAFAFVSLARRPHARRLLDRAAIRFPVVGPMLMNVEISRIAHTFASLLNSGIPLLGALDITRDTVRNRALRDSFPSVSRAVSSGETLASALERTSFYPPLVLNLVRTGEETGELPQMLLELARLIDEEAERTISAAVRLIEPLLIVAMGGIIAGIVAAVILPIFRANTMVAN